MEGRKGKGREGRRKGKRKSGERRKVLWSSKILKIDPLQHLGPYTLTDVEATHIIGLYTRSSIVVWASLS